MKIDLANTTVTESNVLDIEEVEMKFSESALPHLTRMFVNLYNNPDEAVYREILFNAIDATKKMGNDEKIEVYLPTKDTPVLTIADKGVGMSLEDLKRNSQFGGTDKNDENDSVGGFGLGFKSPLSITSQFSVESIKNGDRTVVTISNSEDGICRMSVLLREETDLPNGTTVSVPVKNVYEMRKVAERYTSYVPEMVTYFNRNEYPYFTEQTHYTNYKKVFEGFYDANEYYTHNLTIVMGGVPYIVSYDDLGFHVPELKGLFRGHYILEAPIGSITLSPNREGVQFNQLTKDTIKELLFGRLTQFLEEFQKSIDEAETFAEARKKVKGNSAVAFTRGNQEWKGVPLGYGGTYLGMWTKEMEDINGNKFNKSFNYKLTQILKDRTDSTISKISIGDKKVLFIEPHEDVKTSRFTYLVRQYFLKNGLDFDEHVVFRTEGPTAEYTTAYDTLSSVSVNDSGNNLMLDVLDHLKREYEVVSILDIKEDLEGWKAPKKVSTESKPKVKYLDRMVSFLHDDSGIMIYSRKTISDILGDGDKKLGIYEHKSSKDEGVVMNRFDTEVFNKFIKDNHEVDELDGVIILENNAKPEVLIKNTQKFGNEYVIIEDFYSITKFGEIDRVEEILSSDLKTISLLNSWSYNFIKTMDNDYGKIKDTNLRKILDSGTEELVPDDAQFLGTIRLRDSQAFSDLVRKFIIDKVDLTEIKVDRILERCYYMSIRNVLDEFVEIAVKKELERYPLVDRDRLEHSLEYMNMMFDHKYNK